MTEKEEAVGRQRLAVLVQHQNRLISLGTERDLEFPPGNQRHEQAIADYNTHASLVALYEADQFIVAVQLLDAEVVVTNATEILVEAQKQLALQQAAVDKATTEVTEAQTALDVLKTP